jgi:transposase
MSDAIVGIDVSKETLDANCARGQRKQARIFENGPDGWKLLLSWLKAMGSKQAHVCMEATGRHSLGVASIRPRSVTLPAPNLAATRPTRSMPL